MTLRSTPGRAATIESSTRAPGIAISASTVARTGGSFGKKVRYTSVIAEKARSVGTPFYVYDPGAALARFRRLSRAFEGVDHLHCVALKANSQPALLRPRLAA